MTQHCGIYPATVTAVHNTRIRARVPHVLGSAVCQWASPMIIPVAMPAPGDQVLVMFLGGDIRQPVWIGGSAATPPPVPPPGP